MLNIMNWTVTMKYIDEKVQQTSSTIFCAGRSGIMKRFYAIMVMGTVTNESGINVGVQSFELFIIC